MAKIDCTEYLLSKMEDMQTLVEQLNDYFDSASILGCDTKGKKIQLTNNDLMISDYEQNQQGFVARVLQDGRYFEYSFNNFKDIEDVFNEITKAYKVDRAILDGISASNLDEILCDKSMTYEDSDQEVEITFNEMDKDEVIHNLMKLQNKAREKYPEIGSMVLQLVNVHVSKVFISSTKQLTQSYMFSEVNTNITFSKEDKFSYEFGCVSGNEGLEILNRAFKMIDKTCKNGVDMLESKPIVPGVYDVICDPEVSGLIAHEAFGHGVEMDMFVKNRALAKDYMNQRVASELVTMIDGSRSVNQEGSYLFDDEGNLGTDTVLIDKGILVNGINDQASSQRLGVKPTGNGRRESFERKAYSRMTNTYFAKGKDTLEQMIASIEDGYLLEGASSGMEDPKHWGIQCILSRAREIKDGKLTGNVFGPIILTGYVPDLLKSISMVSDECVLFGGGGCGKGYKEFVKVSDGGPYIKAKARLG